MILFLKKVVSAGILLEVVDGKLKLFTKEKEVDGELLAEIKSRKSEIISFLRNNEQGVKVVEAIPRTELSDHYPVSPGQKRIWIISQDPIQNKAYNIFGQILLNKEINIPLIKKAILATIDRHEILRTRFFESNGQIFQKIMSISHFKNSVRSEDYRRDKRAQLFKKIEEENAKAFDLQYENLLKIIVFRVSDKEHLLYYKMHHIISDGWSMDIFKRDILQFYEAFRENRKPDLPELRIQYKDFTIWQLEQLKSDKSSLGREYWLSKLKGDLPLLDLPFRKRSPKGKDNQAIILGLPLTEYEKQEIQSFIVAQEGTLFIFFIAVLNVLFQKYTEERDFIIGTPVAGRSHKDLENQIGFYTNTIALRNQVNPEISFQENYKNIKTSILSDYKHQDYPFDRLVGEIEMERQYDRNPIFDAMLSIENDNELLLGQNNKCEEPFEVGRTYSKFEVNFQVKEQENGILIYLTYNMDVYQDLIMRRMLMSYRKIIQRVVSDPDVLVKDIAVLSKIDMLTILNDLNDTDFPLTNQSTLVDLFKEQVKITPNIVAVSSGTEQFTYFELNELSDKMANYLYHRPGLDPKSLIGIELQRDSWILVSILGVLKAGHGYVPIDIAYPSERKEYLKKDAHCNLTISQEFIEQFKRELYTIEDIPLYQKHEPSNTDLAYVIYTSGSTGAPKGVKVTHSNVVNLISYQTSYFKVTQEDKFILFSSISFDASIEQLFLPLFNGAQVYIPTKESILDIDRFKDILIQKEITHLHAVPSFLKQIRELPEMKIKRVVSGGELFDIQILKNWGRDVGIYNEYGPTETTVTAIQCKMEADTPNALIGKPLGNTKCYILNEFKMPTPIGVNGELYIGGKGVAEGYLGRSQLTAEKFIESPFNSQDRLYRTGDVVRWTDQGEIEFVGRADRQVKLRGYRIELGEIEHFIRSYSENINQAVVLIHKGSLIAYLTEEHKIDKKTLKKYLKEKLPDYMIPVHFQSLEFIPLTPNGKLDRKALEHLNIDYKEDSNYIPPRNEEESILVNIWQNILRVEKIGIQDNFFELGGHSLLIQEILFKSNKELGISLTYNDIFKFSTIQELSKIVKNQKQSAVDNIITQEIFLIKKGENEKKNLFFIHDGVGSVKQYSPLIETMEGYNCWGIKSKLFNSIIPQNIDITELATNYLEQIKIIQKEGPYTLIGWSSGGVIGYEMARLLEEQNEGTNLLMIDSSFPARLDFEDISQPFSKENDIKLFSTFFPEFNGINFQVNDLSELWSHIIEELDHNEEMTALLVDSINLQQNESERSRLNTLTIREKVMYYNTIRTISRMNGLYTPRALKRPWTYVKAVDSRSSLKELKILGGNKVEIIELKGDHYSIMEPSEVFKIEKIIQSNAFASMNHILSGHDR